MMKLSEFFNETGTKNIVINSDIDGFLSGMLLQNYYECKVVGFTNSKDAIWLSPDVKSIYDPVYIDIFVNNRETYCIDQHIVAYDVVHLDHILSYGTKLNPNLNMQKRTYLESFTDKYPFGTVHYLIALMKADAKEPKFNDITKMHEINGLDGNKYKICPGQVILRADDAFYTSLIKYKPNSRYWWNELKKYNSETINRLCNYLYSYGADKKRIDATQAYVENFFIKALKCTGKDGAFNRISDDGKTLKDEVLNYNTQISKIVGLDLNLPKEVKLYKGTPKIGACTKKTINEAVTYAFVFGPSRKEESFSFTIDIE